MIRRVGANPLLKPISKMSLKRLLRSCVPIVVQEATFVIDVLNELIIGWMKYMIQTT